MPTKKRKYTDKLPLPPPEKINRTDEPEPVKKVDWYAKALKEVTLDKKHPKKVLERIRDHPSLYVGENLNIHHVDDGDTGVSAGAFAEYVSNSKTWSEQNLGLELDSFLDVLQILNLPPNLVRNKSAIQLLLRRERLDKSLFHTPRAREVQEAIGNEKTFKDLYDEEEDYPQGTPTGMDKRF